MTVKEHKLPAIKSKLPNASTTIFAIMSGLANETGAINLSQGFPDFPVSEELIALYHDFLKKGYNQYAPMPGIASLRNNIAVKMSQRYGAIYNPDSEITVTAGGTQAIFTALMAVIQQGDEVILFEPAYDSYIPSIELAGGKTIPVNLSAPDYKINWTEVKNKINDNTRMIMINSPHNPTGSVLGEDDIRQLIRLTENTDILVLSDEVYEHIIFDGIKHQSVAMYPELRNKSFIVYSFGKTFHATGWKTGYCLASENLMKEFRKVHQFNVFSVNTPLQHALAEYMQNTTSYEGIESFYENKRDLFRSLISNSRFTILPCSGSYFQLLDYSSIADEKDTDYAIRLTREFGIASIPVSVFYTHPPESRLLRLCFAKTDATLQQAAQKLLQV